MEKPAGDQQTNISLMSALQDADTEFLLWINRLSEWVPAAIFFRIVSRLGDGVFWYSLIAVLLYQKDYMVALHLIAVAITGLIIYKLLKKRTLRARPFVNNPLVILRGNPLDEFSFPSGHTLHAFSLTIVWLAYYPLLGIFLVPFTLLIAASRCVLGLHYPSDVVAGGSIGLIVASLSFLVAGA